MTNSLAIKTTGQVVISEEQAHSFAVSIFSDIKAYIAEHRAEYEEWLSEQGGDSDES